MPDSLVVERCRCLKGVVDIKAAKNSVLPLLAASVLSKGKVTLLNCPDLSDIRNMLRILEALGASWGFQGSTVTLDTSSVTGYELPEGLSGELRSSIFMLGPLLARFGKAVAPYPGGCEIGLRPIDIHLRALRELNAHIEDGHGVVYCECDELSAAAIALDYPSVGATENIMMAAVGAKGKTVIYNAAREPEIEDLQNFLNAMGARVSGAGSYCIEVTGSDKLHGCTYAPIGDRIAAGTYLTACAMTGGELSVKGVMPCHISQITSKLIRAGVRIKQTLDSTTVISDGDLRAVDNIETMPYPGFPTDMQAQLFALAAHARGTTVIHENVFENRFRHAPELTRMGADITVRDRVAVIRGVPKLYGTRVTAGDLRGGAALVLAGLVAEGKTTVNGCEHISRGYEDMALVLRGLGAAIAYGEDG